MEGRNSPVDNVKTVLQIACLAALLVVLVIAGVSFFRFVNLLDDLRESPFLQPLSSSGLEGVKSVVDDSEILDVLDSSEAQVQEKAEELVKEVEDFGQIDRVDVPGLGIADQEGNLKDEDTLEEPRSEDDASLPAPTEVDVYNENICGRTPEIQQLLIEMLHITKCRDITGEELLRVRELELREMPLEVGDLDGFINLKRLTLVTRDAPVGLFDDLANLEHLGLGLEIPPSPGLFSALATLKEMELGVRAEIADDEIELRGLFEGLDTLEKLEMNFSDGSDGFAVPLVQGSLSGVPKLQNLAVSSVNRVESGIFSDLPELRFVEIQAISLPDHLSKPSIPSDLFVESPDLGGISFQGFRETSRLEFNSLDVICRMQRNMDLMYGVDFAAIVKGETVEIIDYGWDDETLECTLRVAPEGTEHWEEKKVSVSPLPRSRRS